MSLRLSLLLKLSKRRFSVNTASTSFSDQVLTNSLPQIDRHCNYFLENLSEDLMALSSLRKKIEKVRGELQNCFKNGEIQLIPIGSASNGLLHRRSDLDLVLVPAGKDEKWKSFEKKFTKNENFRMSYMKRVRDAINSKRIGRCEVPYFHARTPIIRLESSRKLQVDIQFAGTQPIRSSIFIRTCVEFDERVALLIHWLYKRFEEVGILDSSKLLFSRYHVNVLVLHFLQAIPQPVLPDIIHVAPWCHPNYDRNNLVKISRQNKLYVASNVEMTNEMSVGELAVRLIDYYSQFDFYKQAIDTRGRILGRTNSNTSNFEIVDEYFPEPTCRVLGAPQLLTEFFAKMKSLASRGRYDDLFNYHFL